MALICPIIGQNDRKNAFGGLKHSLKEKKPIEKLAILSWAETIIASQTILKWFMEKNFWVVFRYLDALHLSNKTFAIIPLVWE